MRLHALPGRRVHVAYREALQENEPETVTGGAIGLLVHLVDQPLGQSVQAVHEPLLLLRLALSRSRRRAICEAMVPGGLPVCSAISRSFMPRAFIRYSSRSSRLSRAT